MGIQVHLMPKVHFLSLSMPLLLKFFQWVSLTAKENDMCPQRWSEAQPKVALLISYIMAQKSLGSLHLKAYYIRVCLNIAKHSLPYLPVRVTIFLQFWSKINPPGIQGCEDPSWRGLAFCQAAI